MKICKNCGEVNGNDVEFCVNCGKAVFQMVEEQTCPQCGASNTLESLYCVNCGASLTKKETLVPDISNAIDIREDFKAPKDAKELVKCPNCGAELHVNSIFCNKCGTSVAKLNDHKIVQRKICSHCKTPNSPTSPFCSYCYSSLADAVVQDYQIVHENTQYGKLSVKKTFLEGESGKMVACLNCGALNKADERFCVNCGFKLLEEEHVRYCPECGTANEVDAVSCKKCKWSFEEKVVNNENAWTCERCNRVNDDENAFCTYCGTKRS